ADKVVPTPAAAADAEQQIDKRAQRQNVVGDDEVLQIEDGGIFAERLNKAEQVVSQQSRQRQYDDCHHIKYNRFFAAPAPKVLRKGQNVFKNSDDGGQRGKGHEHKEQCAPDAAARHIVKDVWQGDKD